MSIYKELRALKDKGIEQISGPLKQESFDLTPYYEAMEHIEAKTFDREDITKYYLMGFSSGVLVDEMGYFKSRQSLFNIMDTLDPKKSYRAIHRKNLDKLRDVITYYKGFILVDQEGVTPESIRWFRGSIKQVEDYYINHGGKRDVWQLGSYTNSKYEPYFDYFNQGMSLQRLIEKLKASDHPLNDKQRKLIKMDDQQINSMSSAYGRYKKQRIYELILTGHDYPAISEIFTLSLKQYRTHYDNLKRRVLWFADRHADLPNLTQHIKRQFKVVGDQANPVIQQMINQ